MPDFLVKLAALLEKCSGCGLDIAFFKPEKAKYRVKNGENTPIGSIFTIYTRGYGIWWPGCGRLRQAAEAAEAAAACHMLADLTTC